MKVLFVSSESNPFIKTGGLADVALALPKELANLRCETSVIIPFYSSIKKDYPIHEIAKFNVRLCWRNLECTLLHSKFGDLDFYFIKNDYYFNRDSLYGYSDDAERFAFFSNAVLEAIKYMNFSPDVIHCNDWHTGILIPMLKVHYSNSIEYSNIKTVFTIHNLRYQGVFPKTILNDVIPFGEEYFTEDKFKFYDSVSFMKAGINFADIVTTVSETYAQEIQTPEYGDGLDGLLREKSYKLKGIVNGIDCEVLDPATDSVIYYNYDLNSIDKKYDNKTDMQNELGLKVDKTIPLIGIVTRLTEQKGMDLVDKIVDRLMDLNMQIVLLGTGDAIYENSFSEYSKKYPEMISSNILFDNSLASKIYAASDMFLMPSRFEPCGISQLISMRYGTIPVARKTGGLNDTIIDFSEEPNNGTGFLFEKYNENELFYAIRTACDTYKNPEKWSKLIKNAMLCDNSWNHSAEVYLDLYTSI